MKKKLLVVIGIIVIITIGIGGKVMLDNKKQEDKMIKIVNSQEAKEVFENGLKVLDPKALTEEGIIKSYEIDEESIKHNPMGGINGTLIIDADKELYVRFHLDKNNNGQFKKSVISGNSSKLGEKLRGGTIDD
ncbi:hypothetical protein UAW_00816 [Enterococcus haemoperoxidus ATCC BAA-382]|uniref:DUF1310 family protein n=1 Tax=Enterococcus haemoperoxidus ATCC BAA-382 TaxID=1158608 RepID=R2QWA1_9ENTE|nr:DUF1310 family protein [Enterococcus haemoperoxidus]EOH99663.1 hypothetical protein UAW_00816 [Enterococcus haemoperoxidus ATCC BAA-382]EOT62597.1 hypothetical protein I583_01597 [Enterococcus haemoperoxidus ATCC BAA-382]OJG55063.1 hypothetical protein RV06_GL002100 [Enterococcus haemoperoxidus]